MAVEVTVIKSIAVDPSFFQQIASSMPEWFQQGGSVMWLLLLTSFIVTIITLERLFVWIDYLLKKEHFPLNDCFASLNKREKDNALVFCQTLDTPALNMLEFGIKALPFAPNEKMQSYAVEQANKMSQGQSLLSSAMIIAPILGLLGTLLLLIESFTQLSLQTNSTTNELLNHLAQALTPLTVAVGVMLLALIPYRLFQVQIQKLIQHLAAVASEFNHICQQKSLITNQISEIMQLQEQRLVDIESITETVAEQSEMPYHYEFKAGSDHVDVNLHAEMKDLHKTSQSSLIDMYKNELNSHPKNKKIKENAPSSLVEMYQSAVNEEKELYGVNEVELQEQQETAHLKKAERAN